jgi:hypothetical protein
MSPFRPEVRRCVEALLAGMPNLAKSPHILRQVRAIAVLEHLASKEATRLLTELADGLPHAAQTREARTALERLAWRAANR